MNITINIDKNYVNQAYVTLLSIDKTIKTKYNLYVLTSPNGINEKEFKNKIKSFKKIDNIKFISKNINNELFTISKNISLASYLRIFLPEVLKDVDKILFLDVDIIVRKDLSEEYKRIDFKKYPNIPLAAKVDPFSKIINFTFLKRKYPYFRKMDMKNYFNAGVMFLNLNELRRIEFTKQAEKFISELNKNKKTKKQNILHAHDQDIFNYVLLGPNFKTKPMKLEKTWNWSLGLNMFGRFNLIFKPAVIHFQGMYKPWNKGFKRIKFILYWGALRYKWWNDLYKEIK